MGHDGITGHTAGLQRPQHRAAEVTKLAVEVTKLAEEVRKLAAEVTNLAGEVTKLVAAVFGWSRRALRTVVRWFCSPPVLRSEENWQGMWVGRG